MNRTAIALSGTDPYENLAIEERVFDNLAPGAETLLLYVNSATVVIGKHQNPWLEVNLPELAKRKMALARRISGGGTVYHDTGNVNFSFLVPREGFDRRKNEVNVTPIFSSKVIDTIGAGDAFFSFTAPCFAKDMPLDLVSFIGNAVGALAVQIVGNKQSVEKYELLEFIHAILK